MAERVYYNYIFFSVDHACRDVNPKQWEKYKQEFTDILTQKHAVRIHGYTTLGLKKDIVIMLWMQSASISSMQKILYEVMHTKLGQYLHISYTLFGIKRKSVYGNKRTDEREEKENQTRATYLVIYPFTKTSAWYQLNFAKRKELMHEHISVGYSYPHIKQHLLYAIGIDDYEFIVSYETENLEDFQNLVMDMRSTKVRVYTLSDTPIFTCHYIPLVTLADWL